MAKKKRKMLWWILGSVGLLLVVIVLLAMALGGNQRAMVEVEAVAKVQELEAKVTASGEIKPKQYVNLQSEIAGVITELKVQEGDHVKKGDILMRIDPVQTESDRNTARFQMEASGHEADNTRKQIEEAKLNLRISESTLKSAQADLDQAKINYEREDLSFRRKSQLYEQKLISVDDFDLARSTLQVMKSRVVSAEERMNELKTRIEVSKLSINQMDNSYKAAQNRVSQYQSMLSRAEDMLSKTVLTSPLDGVITKLDVEKGERAVPGNLNNPSATLMTIADLSIIEAEIKVDETDIIYLRLNQPAIIKVDALPDKPLKGHVTEIGNSAITAGTTVGGSDQAKDFKVVVQLDDPPENLRPGLSATAEITTSVKKNVLAIPLQALVSREMELNDKGEPVRPVPTVATENKDEKKDVKKDDKKRKDIQGVFMVDKVGKATFVPVTTGITGSSKIEVLTGVKEGDEIVVGSFKTLRTLKDGDLVMKKKAGSGPPAKEGKEG